MLEISETVIENCKSIRNEMRSAISSLLKVTFFANCGTRAIVYKNGHFHNIFLLVLVAIIELIFCVFVYFLFAVYSLKEIKVALLF